LAGEVADLQANHFAGETDVKGRTRGVKVCPGHVSSLNAPSCYAQNDAFKSERDMDRALEEQGITDADQDVEIGRATGA
jgi:hypothetical protein